jgi:alpha-beta hydrolase superfamily lysophospholipase
MGAWPGGQLVMLPKAEHEVMMEQPHLRRQVFDQTAALFAANHSR